MSQEIVTYFPLDITPTNGAGPNHPASIGSASIRIANLDLTLPNNALFQINAGPVQRYLVQTDPQFVGTRSWLSSDYMLNQLGITNSVRQLGDGFYEQQLIQRQVQQITGQRYLSGYLLGKYIPGGLAKAEEKALSKGSSGTSPEISKTSEEIEALRKIAGNPNGADLSNKAPNTVLNQKAVQDIFDGTLPGTPIDPKRPWTPRQMPESSNPSATAEDFALRVLGRNPTAEELARGSAMNKGNCQGCWYAKNADDIIVTYRPAGYASKDTLPSTATVELNGANTINKLNVDDNGRATIIKLKFPLQ